MNNTMQQSKRQFTLLSLIGFVLYGGAWCATLFSLTDAAAVAINTAVFVALVSSISLAISGNGRPRVFWLGFSLSACFFDIYALVPGNNFLATTYFIRCMFESSARSPFWPDWSVEVYRLSVTANALFSIPVGACGGVLARYWHFRKSQNPTGPEQ